MGELSKNELKPCPFCGSSSELCVTELCVIGGDECGWYVECFNCFATGGNAGTRDKAIEVWNTRAERTCRNVDEYADAGFFTCGVCGFGSNGIELTPNYCPECGARVIAP